MLDRVLGFEHDPHCPKCGSHALAGPYYHSGRRQWFWHFAFGLLWARSCVQQAIDHFHYRCMSCRVWHNRACHDIKETI